MGSFVLIGAKNDEPSIGSFCPIIILFLCVTNLTQLELTMNDYDKDLKETDKLTNCGILV